MHDMIVALSLGGGGVHELRDGAVPRHVPGIGACAAGAHVCDLCSSVRARVLGEADGCGAQQAATACDRARGA